MEDLNQNKKLLKQTSIKYFHMLIKREVTSKQAFKYLKEQLVSDKTLSSFLSQQDIESGKVYTFVPESTSEEQLYNFEVGGLYPSEKKFVNGTWLSKVINEAKPLVEKIIEDYLSANHGNYCVFEECNGTPNSPWVINSKIEYVYIGDEMYYFFNRENNINEKLKQAFLHSGGWYFLCVLSSLRPYDYNKIEAFHEISPMLIEAIAHNTTAFFVDAYDGEGYLMWEK